MESIRDMAGHTDEKIRLKAVDVIGMIPSQEGIAALLEMADSAEENVKRAIIKVLHETEEKGLCLTASLKKKVDMFLKEAKQYWIVE